MDVNSAVKQIQQVLTDNNYTVITTRNQSLDSDRHIRFMFSDVQIPLGDYSAYHPKIEYSLEFQMVPTDSTEVVLRIISLGVLLTKDVMVPEFRVVSNVEVKENGDKYYIKMYVRFTVIAQFESR